MLGGSRVPGLVFGVFSVEKNLHFCALFIGCLRHKFSFRSIHGTINFCLFKYLHVYMCVYMCAYICILNILLLAGFEKLVVFLNCGGF